MSDAAIRRVYYPPEWLRADARAATTVRDDVGDGFVGRRRRRLSERARLVYLGFFVCALDGGI